ncbi:hypothetical protein V500_02084 [Pseudogymnoascus sp. VKM F-4518 (FW-2643)]|nr:hypothetical protein V500_02084 [Pseudogymnoascus sp. VKM F-4518 (FW-2643)]
MKNIATATRAWTLFKPLRGAHPPGYPPAQYEAAPPKPPPTAKRQRLNNELTLPKGDDVPQTAAAAAAEEIGVRDGEPSYGACNDNNPVQALLPSVNNSQSARRDKYEIKDSDEDSDDALSRHSPYSQAAVADRKIYDGICKGSQTTGAIPEIPDSEYDPSDALSVNSPQATDVSHFHPFPSRPRQPMDVDEDDDDDSVVDEEGSTCEDGEVSLSGNDDRTIVEDEEEGSLFEDDGEVSLSENEEVPLSENEEEELACAPNKAPKYYLDKALAYAPNKRASIGGPLILGQGPSHAQVGALSAYSAGEEDCDNEDDAIFNALNEDEDAFEDAMGNRDEDFVPSPDYDNDDNSDQELDEDEDSSDLLPKVMPADSIGALLALYPAQQVLDGESDESVVCFEHRIRTFIQVMKRHAQRVKYNPNRVDSTYPLSFSMWSLLRQVSIESFMAAFMAAIPDKVKVALGGATIDHNAILSLDRDWQHYQAGGIYVDLAFDKSVEKYGCYVGSTRRHFHHRIRQHLRVADRFTPDTLSSEFESSSHYRYICKATTNPNFRILAIFRDKNVPAGYLYLLEAIMIAMLQSISPPYQGCKWHNGGSHEIVRESQVAAGIPEVNWAKLNVAWPAVQGFGMKRPSCQNKACSGLVSRNIGSGLCYVCIIYMNSNGHLPTENQLSRLVSRQQALKTIRRNAGPDPKCGDCGRRESELSICIKKFGCNRLLPGVLLCHGCDAHLSHKRLRTPDEKIALVVITGLVARRKIEPISCDNCSVLESSTSVKRHDRHSYVPALGKVLCNACHFYFSRTGRHRDMALAETNHFARNVNEKRDEGIPIHCTMCSATEPSGDRSQRFRNPKGTDSLYCRKCYYRRDYERKLARKSKEE